MFSIRLSRVPIIVCLGAHCDDIEIGCGGTLAALAAARPDAQFHCWVFSGDETRAAESKACLEALLGSKRVTLQMLAFRDGFFPADWAAIKTRIRELRDSVEPELVFTHADSDRHQDHRVLCELTWNHFRRHTVLEYEIVKYDGDLARPNVYVPLSAAVLDAKINALMASFSSQAGKHWFTRSTFEAIARLRGVECNAPSGFAEAFGGRKVCLAPDLLVAA
ncbi:MAG: PIG-L family deacetylase [Aquincola sp.]|nr:PIG-L family deacetylase [Aquincola sp.]